MDIRLAGHDYRQLMDALLDAYAATEDLEMMLRLRLDKRLNQISTAPQIDIVIFRVVDDAQAKGWTGKLIDAARADRPDNDKVQAIAQRFGFSSTNALRAELESIVARSSRFVDVTTWSSRLIELEAQVCRVEVPIGRGGVVKGTGFLVGPSTVLTNYHVIEPVIMGVQGKTTAKGWASQPNSVVLRFGYKRSKDGVEVESGLEYRLASENWMIDSSPPSSVDLVNSLTNQLPQPDELDYALLRLSEKAGYHLVNAKSEPKSDNLAAPTRGWVQAPATSPDLDSDGSVLIMQHPLGAPLKLAFGTSAYVGMNKNNTRLRYSVSTEQGSSGSPVFNVNWELAALHHLGDLGFEERVEANQGIPIGAIRSLLEKRGKASVLDEK